MMIKAILLFAFVGVALASHVKWPPHGIEDCKQFTGATDAEVKLFLGNKVPRYELATCFYGCMWQKMKLMNDDMTFSPAVLNEYILYLMKHPTPKHTPEVLDKTINLLTTCTIEVNKEPVPSEDPKAYCFAAKQFGLCADEQMNKLQFGEYIN